MTTSKTVKTYFSRFLALAFVMTTALSTTLSAARMDPVIFAAGLTFPNTTKDITPNNPEVEQRLKEYFEQGIEMIFLHNMGKNKDPWYGVRGSIIQFSIEESSSNSTDKDELHQRTSFTVQFTDLAQVHNPFKNIKKVEGKHYARNVTFIKDIDSPQTVATFLHEIILPSLPSSHRSQELRRKLAPLTSINQIVQELIIHFKLEASEEQAVRFLEFNFSIQDKLRILMELFEDARKNGKLSGGRSSKDPASRQDELTQFQEKLESLDMPDKAREEIEEAVEQFEGAKGNPHEEPMLRNYLKFALGLPWSTGKDIRTREDFDLAKIEHYLDKNQYGMEEVKDRMLDYLALRNLSPTPTPTIICLVGAPGVGKTSICKVIADALDKKFARIALGGVHSEADIRGHRRTYVGAMPGRILEAMKRVQTSNPVLVLDEIDKLGTENQMHGDPSAALLEALDPEQNNEFTDHYLGVPFDLSRVIFIATANDLHKIPPALRDRMDVIQVPSYTLEDKVTIAQKIIVPKLIARSGLIKKPPVFSNDVLRAVIENHTFEDGMRGFTNKLNVLIAKYARGYLKGENIVFTVKNLAQYLGKAHAQLEEFKRKAKNIEPALNKDARKKLFDAIDRYDNTKEYDTERPRLKEYISLFTQLPWNTTTIDNDSLKEVNEHLEKTHYGLEKVNERILDALALRKRSEQARATILCLVGPPGVGKTSIGKAIAEAMGKKFERVALGGVSNESDIRGLSRSYIGAGPGRILKALANAGSKNALIMLDEVDKMGRSMSNGDPSAALLEVLDPEQNDSFTDHYLGVPFDLSKVLFIATANDINNIPLALYDRMEIVNLEGYNTEQKIQIAQRHILPRLTEQSDLIDSPPPINTALLRKIIKDYTVEAGVRKLTNRLNTFIAKYARAIEYGKQKKFDPNDLTSHLGLPIKRLDPMPTKDKVGVVNGLYAGMAGGGIGQIEVVAVPRYGNSKEKITGMLGRLATETAHTALTYAITKGLKWGTKPDLLKTHSIHINMPGGTEKDGNSAGAAKTTAIVSLLSNRPIRHDYAMTGTINFQGQVGAIGGVGQKLEGAHRNKMKYIIFSEENRDDVEELKNTPADIEIIFVRHIDEILSRVLLPAEKQSATLVS